MIKEKAQNNLFVVILRYIVPLEKIDAFRPSHLEFLEYYYKENLFIISGTQVPRSGGIIFAMGITKEELQKILLKDPFAINNLATYEIIEFTPTKWNDEFYKILCN